MEINDETLKIKEGIQMDTRADRETEIESSHPNAQNVGSQEYSPGLSHELQGPQVPSKVHTSRYLESWSELRPKTRLSDTEYWCLSLRVSC